MTSGAWTSWALPGWWNQSTTDRPRNQETLLSSRVFWSYSSFTELGQRVLHSLTVVYKRHWRFDARTLLITPIHRAFMTCLQIQRRQKKKKRSRILSEKGYGGSRDVWDIFIENWVDRQAASAEKYTCFSKSIFAMRNRTNKKTDVNCNNVHCRNTGLIKHCYNRIDWPICYLRLIKSLWAI